MIGAVTLLRIASCVERFIIRNGHAESCGDLRENEPVPALAQHAHRSIWTLVAAVSSYLVTALLLSNHRFDTVESLNFASQGRNEYAELRRAMADETSGRV
jgi:hypothetical protein